MLPLLDCAKAFPANTGRTPSSKTNSRVQIVRSVMSFSPINFHLSDSGFGRKKRCFSWARGSKPADTMQRPTPRENARNPPTTEND
jgi:hypothetical protein